MWGGDFLVCSWRLPQHLSVVEGTSRAEAVPEIDRGHGCRPLVNALVSDIAMVKERRSAFSRIMQVVGLYNHRTDQGFH